MLSILMTAPRERMPTKNRVVLVDSKQFRFIPWKHIFFHSVSTNSFVNKFNTQLLHQPLHIRGAFNNLSTWVRKKQLITKKILFYFSMWSPNNSIHFAHFCCNDFIPLGKKSFDCSSNQVVTAFLTSSSLENRLPRRIFFITRNRK